MPALVAQYTHGYIPVKPVPADPFAVPVMIGTRGLTRAEPYLQRYLHMLSGFGSRVTIDQPDLNRHQNRLIGLS